LGLLRRINQADLDAQQAAVLKVSFIYLSVAQMANLAYRAARSEEDMAKLQ
jgi:hypothetical protein